jgi:hypothetical protein
LQGFSFTHLTSILPQHSSFPICVVIGTVVEERRLTPTLDRAQIRSDKSYSPFLEGPLPALNQSADTVNGRRGPLPVTLWDAPRTPPLGLQTVIDVISFRFAGYTSIRIRNTRVHACALFRIRIRQNARIRMTGLHRPWALGAGGSRLAGNPPRRAPRPRFSRFCVPQIMRRAYIKRKIKFGALKRASLSRRASNPLIMNIILQLAIIGTRGRAPALPGNTYTYDTCTRAGLEVGGSGHRDQLAHWQRAGPQKLGEI